MIADIIDSVLNHLQAHGFRAFDGNADAWNGPAPDGIFLVNEADIEYEPDQDAPEGTLTTYGISIQIIYDGKDAPKRVRELYTRSISIIRAFEFDDLPAYIEDTDCEVAPTRTVYTITLKLEVSEE